MLPGTSLGNLSEHHRAALALLTGKKWQNGRTLRISFMDGEGSVIDRVKRHANKWMDYANIKFQWVDSGGEIRITFADEGSWSYLGTDALTIFAGEATMCYGWLTPDESELEYQRVVLHEFGHALGAVHEHQNPAGGIPWDREAVIRYYSGPPNNWSLQDIEHNLFRRYEESQTNFRAFDRKSIMAYPIPNEFTVGDYSVPFNTELSEGDKQFIAYSYPKPLPPPPPVETLSVPLTTLARYPSRYFDKDFDITVPDRYGKRIPRWHAERKGK